LAQLCAVSPRISLLNFTRYGYLTDRIQSARKGHYLELTTRFLNKDARAAMQLEFIQTIERESQDDWNSLWKNSYPFTRYEFLNALEKSGSTTEQSGWQPYHLIGKDSGRLVFAMPMYLKTHSYGEYVFDWSWADAYARTGLDYYPKLLNAIPFTPATGPRWGVAEEIDLNFDEVLGFICEHAHENQISSFHSLFPDAQCKQTIHTKLSQRQGCQFHWFNDSYANFDDYLSHFSSRKRKNIRKERSKTSEFTITIESAENRSKEDWHWFYQLYHRTYLKRSGRPGYLSEAFFTQLAETMPEQLLLAIAEHKGQNIAGAVYFRDDHCLYGRYWGTMMDIDALHFETCYYRGIDYAIAHNLQRFDPGAQGEHKIQRGFQPVTTCSYHWLAHPEFDAAIKRFCSEEAGHNQSYVNDARSYLPFKEGFSMVDKDILLSK